MKKDIGIYIHIPFCKSKCSYCDFYSMPSALQERDAYISELKREILSVSQNHLDKTVDTVYIGGGTPSMLSVEEIESLLFTIHQNFKCKIEECTIEINPCTSNDLSRYKDIGINRISIGAQSLNDDILKILGRKHTTEQAIDSLERAAKYFDNISADFILGVKEGYDIEYGIKNSPFYDVYKDAIKHISAYILKVEKNTPLYEYAKKSEYTVLNDDELANQYDKAYRFFHSGGFMRYEISNFAKPGYESRHNMKYWNMSPYLGFGVNAHSYIAEKRYYNKKDLNSYLQGQHSGQNKQVYEKSEKFSETVMLGLRTREGLKIKEINKEFGINFLIDYQNQLKKVKNFLDISEDFIIIKDEYLLLQNSITVEILY